MAFVKRNSQWLWPCLPTFCNMLWILTEQSDRRIGLAETKGLGLHLCPTCTLNNGHNHLLAQIFLSSAFYYLKNYNKKMLQIDTWFMALEVVVFSPGANRTNGNKNAAVSRKVLRKKEDFQGKGKITRSTCFASWHKQQMNLVTK